MSQSIKGLMKTVAWKELEELFNKEIVALRDVSLVDYKLDAETYSREVRSRVCAAAILQKFLLNIKNAGRDITFEKPKTYK